MSEPLHAEDVARKDFPVSFRGFDQHEVRSFLGRVAAELGAWEERERALKERIAELEAAPPPELDEAALEAALGREATRIIHAAREAANEIRSKAATESERRLEEANAVLAKSTQEAETAGAAIRAEVEEAMVALREDAQRRAAGTLDQARAEAASMLTAARRNRDELVAQVQALRSARESLLRAYTSVRSAVDDAVGRVNRADDDAGVIATWAAPSPSEDIEEASDAETAAADTIGAPERTEPSIVVLDDAVVEDEPPEVDVLDRRSSTVTIVRGETSGTPVAPATEDAGEGVRILREEPAPDAAPIADAEPEPEPEPEPDLEPVAVEPETEPEPAASGDAPAADEPSTDEGVDDLFARLRADRASKVANAEAVLAATDPSPAEPEAEQAPEPAVALSADAAALAQRDDAVADAERALVRSLKRALADEQNEVLDGLRRLRGAPALEHLLPDPAVHDARYDAVLSSGARAAAVAGGQSVGATGGDGSRVAAELGRGVAVELRGRIDRAIEDSSGDVETLAEAISAAYREWKTSRVEPLVRDVMTAAYAGGVYTAADTDLRWVVDPAEGGCPDCDDNVLAGPTPKGTPFPTGQPHPPAHTGCRCLVVAVEASQPS